MKTYAPQSRGILAMLALVLICGWNAQAASADEDLVDAVRHLSEPMSRNYPPYSFRNPVSTRAGASLHASFTMLSSAYEPSVFFRSRGARTQTPHNLAPGLRAPLVAFRGYLFDNFDDVANTLCRKLGYAFSSDASFYDGIDESQLLENNSQVFVLDAKNHAFKLIAAREIQDWSQKLEERQQSRLEAAVVVGSVECSMTDKMPY